MQNVNARMTGVEQRGTGEPMLRLVDHYVVPMNDGTVQIRTATQKALLSGRLVNQVLPKLLPLLDGSRTREAVIAEAGEERIHIELCLNMLQQKSLLRETQMDLSVPAQEQENSELYKYLSRRDSAEDACATLARAHVAVISTGGLKTHVIDAVAKLGVRRISAILPEQMEEAVESGTFARAAKPVSAAGPEMVRREVAPLCITTSDWAKLLGTVDMIVVSLEGPVVFHPWLEALNGFALEHQVPWTVCALIDEEEIHIGPTIRPGVTACYKCFEMRLKSNLANLGAYQALERFVHTGGKATGFGSLAPAAEIASGLVALEVLRTLHPTDVALTSGRQFVFNTATFSQGFHPVLKLPRCPACSPARQLPRQRVWA